MDDIQKIKKITITNSINNTKKEPIKIKHNEKLQIPVTIKDKEKEIKGEKTKEKDTLGYELKTIKETIRSKDNDFLCKAFFTSGIPNPKINPAEIIYESENSMASCKHKECSIFPGIKPEIINKFPNKTNKFEINASVKK